jgi:hypothetical protein
MFTVYHAYLEDIAAEIGQPDFPNLIPQFISIPTILPTQVLQISPPSREK